MAEGVPESALRLEVDGRNSWESLSASARFLGDEGIDDAADPAVRQRVTAHKPPSPNDSLYAHIDIQA